MRTGEVFALTWNDIDLKNRTIKINKTVYAKDKENKGRWYLGTTKTAGSCREIYICNTLHSMLCIIKNYKINIEKNLEKKYKRYIIEEVRNKYGKLVEYRIVKTIKKSKLLENLNLVFRKENGIYSETDIVK